MTLFSGKFDEKNPRVCHEKSPSSNKCDGLIIKINRSV